MHSLVMSHCSHNLIVMSLVVKFMGVWYIVNYQFAFDCNTPATSDSMIVRSLTHHVIMSSQVPLLWNIHRHQENLLAGLSDYRDSIHYRDSLTLFMNKIVGCWTIHIIIL